MFPPFSLPLSHKIIFFLLETLTILSMVLIFCNILVAIFLSTFHSPIFNNSLSYSTRSPSFLSLHSHSCPYPAIPSSLNPPPPIFPSSHFLSQYQYSFLQFLELDSPVYFLRFGRRVSPYYRITVPYSPNFSLFLYYPLPFFFPHTCSVLSVPYHLLSCFAHSV
jgi:hypothetical protein